MKPGGFRSLLNKLAGGPASGDTQFRKRRVTIDLSILDRTQTGTAVYARELSLALQDLAFDDIEFIHVRGPKPIARKNKLTKVLNLLIELLWIHVILPLRLIWIRADLVHMPANVAPFISPCPIVVTIHDANFCRFPEAYDAGYRKYATLAFRLAGYRASRVITDSDSSARDLEKYFGVELEKISVVYLGGVYHHDATALGYRPMRNPYILFVGALEPHKNVRRLVEAFAEFRRSGGSVARGYFLVIAGGFARGHGEVVAAVDRLGLNEAVRLTGYVAQAQLEQLYRHAAVFAFPSLNEGFGFPPLEAMARGVPVVAAAAGSLPEVLGDAAVYCDPLDVNDIARALSVAAFDEPLRGRLIAAGLRQAKKFTWKNTALSTVSIYKKVWS